MQYIEPVGAQGAPNDFGHDYVDKNAGLGIAGSFLAADVPEHVLIEILNAIVSGGLTPSGANLKQLAQAIQSGKSTYAVASGTANTWTVAPNLAVPAYSAGRVLNIIAPATNTSTTVNMNVSGLGNRQIKKADGTDPAIGDLVGGKAYATIDDGANVRILTNLASDLPSAGRTQVFTASGTFTVPSTQLEIWGIGGGGAGGCSGDGSGSGLAGNVGGGGGAGAFGYKRISGLMIGSTISVTIGAGGVPSTANPSGGGGSTSFGPHMTCGGGAGGAYGVTTSGSGGAGGTSSGADVAAAGEP